ncbi:hypothetical protein [Vibrio sp. E150_018]
MIKLIYFQVALMFAYASDAFAVHSHTFFPKVTIESNITDSIEIRVRNSLFVTNYSSKERSFDPLKIPFEVISLNDQPIEYRLSLAESSHQCEVYGAFDVEVKLNSNSWSKEGTVFKGISDEHFMTVNYPEIPQERFVSQQCFGTLRVQVEAMSL